MTNKWDWIFLGWVIFALLLVGIGLSLRPPPVQAQAIGYVAAGHQAVTATATLVSGISYGTVCIKALQGNSINVYIGGPTVTTSTGMELAPDDAYCMPTNASPFYVIASTTGASVSWIDSR